MGKLNYLNLGCGNKFHKDWVNIDMVSNSEYVEAVNLLKGIPKPDNSFDVIYHSQVLEHIPKERALDFVLECRRVLKPGGIMRIVVPDLENIIDEYKKNLQNCLENPGAVSDANYDWIMLELYDQTVRNYSGGQMAEYLKQDSLINEQYVYDRIGFVGRSIREQYLSKKRIKRESSWKKTIKLLTGQIRKLTSFLQQRKEQFELGKFRTGGEIHMWMYDRYSLTRLLEKAGFTGISIKNCNDSEIPNWASYELDVKDGLAFDPTSIFVEAKK